MTRFMWRIVRSLFAGLVWMTLQVLTGFVTGYAFADNGVGWLNILYYCWALLSFCALMYYYYRIWRKRDD